MQQSDRAGLLYALAGFCTLSIGDAIVKGMAGLWPAPGMAALDELLRQELWRLPGVQRFVTTIAMRVIKPAGRLTANLNLPGYGGNALA